jgi:hypothetical protein
VNLTARRWREKSATRRTKRSTAVAAASLGAVAGVVLVASVVEAVREKS